MSEPSRYMLHGPPADTALGKMLPGMSLSELDRVNTTNSSSQRCHFSYVSTHDYLLSLFLSFFVYKDSEMD